MRHGTFDSTYKELKHTFHSDGDINPHVLLTLPIRNWNFCLTDILRITYGSFDSTYKELKLHIVFLGTITVPLLTLPIRNWNSLYEHTLSKVYSSFDSTYKELKQTTAKCLFTTHAVLLTLPIRNWNLFRRFLVLVIAFLLTLPIRNWNWDLASLSYCI